MTLFKTFSFTAAMTLGTTVAAQAALVDFTDPSTYTLSGSTGSGSSVDGALNFTLSAKGGNFSNREVANYDAFRVNPLKGERDGLGIGDDEITFSRESVTISFDQVVKISRLFFLDLFGTFPGEMADETDESVTVTSNTGQSGTFFAQTLNQDGTVGFGDFMANLTGTSFTFVPGAENDSMGNPDFALAGLEVSEVPLPAGILLLGGALGGLGLARRKKKAA